MVIDLANDQPVVGAAVQVDSPVYRGTALSDRHGFFALLGIPSATYHVTFHNPGGRFESGCRIVVLYVPAGEIRTIKLFEDTRQRALLHCVMVPDDLVVDPDQTSDVYYVDGAGNARP